jgi:hypothetical protein
MDPEIGYTDRETAIEKPHKPGESLRKILLVHWEALAPLQSSA